MPWNISPLKRLSHRSISNLLAYHQLGPKPYVGLNRISSHRFKSHLDLISEMGFSSDLKYKILFDDGYESVYDIAFPLMKKYGFTGLIFPVVDYIGQLNDWDITFGTYNRARHITAGQLQILSKNGWEIGSHGLTHTAFTALSEKALRNELEESKAILEDIIKKDVTSITPPFSKWNNHIKDMIIKCGYEKIYYQHRMNPIDDEALIPRHSIYSTDNRSSLLRKFKNSKIEVFKELIIHNCSNLTVAVKEIL